MSTAIKMEDCENITFKDCGIWGYDEAIVAKRSRSIHLENFQVHRSGLSLAVRSRLDLLESSLARLQVTQSELDKVVKKIEIINGFEESKRISFLDKVLQAFKFVKSAAAFIAWIEKIN